MLQIYHNAITCKGAQLYRMIIHLTQGQHATRHVQDHMKSISSLVRNIYQNSLNTSPDSQEKKVSDQGIKD